MAIGERIHFFRTLRGMTQKYLGARLGFDEKSADVRIAQYESGTRSPKDNYLALLAETLGVSPLALSVPNIDSYDGLMHKIFMASRLQILMEKSVLALRSSITHPILSFLTTSLPGMSRQASFVKVKFRKKNMTNGVTTTP